MSSSRARTRFAAIFAAVPVLMAGGPLVSPAVASTQYGVTNLMADGQVVGPNTGYLGLGVGQTGTTAMFKVAPPSSSATISSVRLTLTQLDNPGAYVYQNELDPTDGLSLYADVNDNGAFDSADKATGLRSNGFQIGGRVGEGEIPFVITFGQPASGSSTYFVALHPAASAVSGRRFAFRVDAADVTGSGGSGPETAVTTPTKTDTADRRIVVDSAPPVSPSRTWFTNNAQKPGTEDEYSIAPGVTGSDNALKVAFFKSKDSVAPSALLTRPTFDPTKPVLDQVESVAVGSVVNQANPLSPAVVKIGDGSGIFKDANPAVLVAKNNQDTNAVYARLIDEAGNISPAPAELSDCFIAPNTTACETAKRGNPVIGPSAPLTADIYDDQSDSTLGINKGNEAAVQLNITVPRAAALAPTTRAAADTNGHAVKALARITQKTAAGAYDPVYTTAEKEQPLAVFTTGDASASWGAADGFDTRLFPEKETERGIQEGVGIAFARVVSTDRAYNRSLPKESVALSKDLVAPTVVIEAASSTLVKGSTVTVRFNEPMNTADIDPREPNTTGVCQDNYNQMTGANNSSVEWVLNVYGTATSTRDERTWGVANCFSWLSENVATIRLGDPRPTPGGLQSLPSVGDRVVFGTGAAAVRDLAGNALVGLGNPGSYYTTVTLPSGAPVPAASVTKDANADGRLDGVEVQFTTPLAVASVQANLAKFSVNGSSGAAQVIGVSETVANPQKLLFSFADQFGTGERPVLQLVAGSGGSTGVLDKNGNAVAAFKVMPTDAVTPQPMGAKTVDKNRDGLIDDVIVTYSEPILPPRDNNPAEVNGVVVNTTGPAYHVVGYAPAPPTGGTEGRNEATPKTNTAIATRTLALVKPAENRPFDSDAKPTVNYSWFAPGSADHYTPTDMWGNKWKQSGLYSTVEGKWSLTATDGAAPFYVSRLTRDLDSDGRVDAIDVKLTESISTLSAAATFEVTGHQVLDQFGVGTDTIRIVINETAPATGDTSPATTPTIKYLGGITDAVGNAMTPDTAPVPTTDGAAPAIAAACPGSPTGRNGLCPADDPNLPTDDGTKMNVFFSEPLNAGSVAKEDFVVEQPAGAANKKEVASVLVTNSTDNKFSTVTLTFAQNTLSSTTDSVVRLASAGAVADAGNIASTQQANIPAYAPPTVSLNLTCPTPSKPGYCMANTINTGATGSNAITRWRLSETARATVPPDGEFKQGLPAVYPESGVLPEGELVLYFSGKDELGRLSPEVDGIITILKPPSIGQVSFLNKTSRATNKFSKTTTVLDADALEIKANAYGTDVEQWAEDGQPTDGGCLRANMSIDVRSLSGVSTHNAVAPFRCDLQDTTPPHRRMQFPIVTALGTTRFPVGTAIKSSASDPGSLVVDGSRGLVRRPFISVNARRSWMIPDAAVITVPLKAYRGIPASTTRVGFRDGAVLRTSSGGYYYVENGVKRPVAASRLAYWKIPTSRAYSVTSTELSRMRTGAVIGGSRHPVGTWIKYSSGAIYQIVKNASGATVRRKLASTSALRTRVPSTHVYPANRYDSVPIDSWLIGYRDGTLLKFSDGTYGVIARGSLRKFANPLTFNTLGFNNTHALGVNSLAMPRVSGQAFRIGSVIDRYKLGAVVIKVTNNAGAVVTAQVPNSSGLYGVGTLDPRPAGWDMTR